MPDQPPIKEPPPTSPPISKEGSQPLESRFQNYLTLRRHINDQFLINASAKASPFLSSEVNPALTQTAAHIIGQRAIRYLPEGDITQPDLIQAILAAQNELADREVWFAATLPNKTDRKILAETISLTISPSQAQAAVQEEAAFAQATLDDLPEKQTAIAQIEAELVNAGVDPKKSKTLATQLNTRFETWSERSQAATPPPVIHAFVRQAVGRRIENTQNLSERLAQKDGLHQRTEAIGHNADKGLSSIKKGLKITGRFPTSPGLQKVGRVLKAGDIISHPFFYARRAITFPFRYLGRQIARPMVKFAKRTAIKVTSWTVKRVAAFLVKVGLGSLVRYAEELALAGTGFGLPLAIAQELFFIGTGKFFKTVKRIANDYKETFREGMRNPLLGSLKFIGTVADHGSSVVFGSAGAVLGTVSGVAIGALIGSVVPVVGTIIGGIIGGIAGGVFGAGVGADFGYKLRKRVEKMLKARLVLYLLMKALIAKLTGVVVGFGLGGVLGFLLSGGNPLGAVLGGLTGGFIGANAPQILQAVKNFVLNAWQSASGAFQSLTAGPGLVSQTVSGVGNLLGQIPSTIAKGFNTATGWISGTTVNTAATAESIGGQILTTGPSATLVATPIATVGLVTLFSLIAYSVLTAAFFVPPTEVTPFYDDPSRFIKIRKQACVAGTAPFGCTQNQMNLPNPTEQGPYTITYTITVEATDRTLTAVTIKDEYTSFGRYQSPTKAPEAPPAPPARTWDGGIVIQNGRPWTTTLTVSIPKATIWDDAILTNTVTVTATVEGFSDEVTNSKSVTLIFGNPPFCPPNGDPLDNPYSVSGYRYLNPLFHTGVDITNGFGNPIYSTFPCQAQVVFSGWGTGGFGYFVALQSGTWFAFYPHMATDPDVGVGDIVGFGTVLGAVGSTGNSSGPHLHYEIRDGTKGAVNPADNYQPPLTVNPCDFGINPTNSCN